MTKLPAETSNPSVIVLMGVSGAGKTTIGRLLALRLGWHFIEGDDFHPQANIRKMATGIPLNDEDRMPWLERLKGIITEAVKENSHLVIACSALKQSYRDLLDTGDEVAIVYLRVPREILLDRLETRVGHFMKESMLDSQLATLEEPHDALTVDGSKSPDDTVEQILRALKPGETRKRC